MHRPATAMMFVPCFLGAIACADDPRAITAVTSLPRPVVATRQACTIRGVVIGVLPAPPQWPGPPQWIVEDASGGIRVIPPATAATPADEAVIAVGDEIEVGGETETGDFAPCLRARRVVRHGRPSARSPRRCDADSFFAGREDCRLVEIDGVVHQVWHENGSLCMEIETAGRLFTAALPATVAAAALDAVEQDPQALVDATVRVAGPTVSLCNPRGEITRPWVLVERPDGFTVTSTAVTVAESAVPLDWIGTFTPEGDARRRILTFGTVIHAIQGRVLYLQNGHRGITVRLGAGAMGTAERFVPGDLVEVAGFVDRSGPVASIRGAAARKTAHSTPAPPLLATPDTILRINSATTKRVEPGDYEGCLVGLGGVLLQSQPTGDGGILVIRSNEIVVTAESDTETFAALERIQPGSFVHVTGVATIDWGAGAERAAGNRPQRLRLLLRTVADATVVTTPSWWTPSRLAATVAVIGAILMAALAWVWLLRRQLQLATRLLGAEMRSRRDAAIEFAATLRERNRLAANLHDTLQQTIGGIGFQLDACEAIGSAKGADARRHFTVARNMVNHAAQELQGSVWAMRALPLGGKPLVDALRDLVARVGEGHATAISVRADATFADLPEFVAGSVLLIVQEAVHNALRHGKPSRITVTLSARSADGTIGVRVEDDGPGFVVGRQAGPHDGHFGIQGMRERAERLGGTLSIRSRPGVGTVVEATVLRRAYDTEIYDTEIGAEPAPPARGSPG